MRNRTAIQRLSALAGGGLAGRLGRQISLVVVGDGLTFAVVTFSTMILARILPVDWMGTYRQVVYLTQMAITIVDIGVGASIYRFWSLLEADKRAIFVRMALLVSVGLAIPPAIALAVSAPLLAHAYSNDQLALALIITAPIPLATLPLNLIRPTLISQGYSLRATLLETLFALLGIVSMVLPVALGMSFYTALAIWVAVSLGRLVAALPAVFHRYLIWRATWWDKEILRSVWSYLWPVQLARVPAYFTTYLDKVIMSVRLLPRDFAVYSLGAREIPFVGVIAYSVSSVLLPHLVDDIRSGNIAQLCRRWETAALKTAHVTYLFAGFSVWNAAEVMRFLFSNTYEAASVPFRIFALLTYLRVVEFGSVAKAFGQTRPLLYCTAISAVFLGVLGPLLIIPLGIVGMALSVVLAEFIANIYLLAVNRRLLGVPLGEFFPWKKLLAVAGISLVSSAAGRRVFDSLMTFDPADGVVTLGLKLLLLGGVTAVLYVTFLKIKLVLGPGAQAR